MTNLRTSALRLQLLTDAQDEGALDVLHFLEPLVSWRHAKARARRWARGWITGRPVSGIAALIEDLVTAQANEVEIGFRFAAPHEIGAAGLQVRSVRCSVTVAPTNKLWAPVRGFVLPREADEARRASYESRELALRWSGIAACPTLVEALVELDHADRTEDGLTWSFWEAVSGTLTGSWGWGRVCGCADVHDASVYRGNVLEVLAPWPRGYSLLGPRFDDLHPVLLGSLAMCEELRRALGKGVEVRQITAADGAEVLGCAWLPCAVVRDPKSRTLAQSWLVPRDDTTRPRELDPLHDEYRVAGHVFYSRKRSRELRTAGCLPTLPPGFREFPLIARKYCALLGINADDMLVELWQEPLIAKAQREIDNAFDALSGVLPLIDRVWRAHEPTYRKWLYGADERLRFLKDRLYKMHGTGQQG